MNFEKSILKFKIEDTTSKYIFLEYLHDMDSDILIFELREANHQKPKCRKSIVSYPFEFDFDEQNEICRIVYLGSRLDCRQAHLKLPEVCILNTTLTCYNILEEADYFDVKISIDSDFTEAYIEFFSLDGNLEKKETKFHRINNKFIIELNPHGQIIRMWFQDIKFTEVNIPRVSIFKKLRNFFLN